MAKRGRGQWAGVVGWGRGQGGRGQWERADWRRARGTVEPGARVMAAAAGKGGGGAPGTGTGTGAGEGGGVPVWEGVFR